MRQLIAAGALLALAGLAGCGSRKIVPVSGVVKLDGKAYPNAVVSFQPVGTKSSPNPGRGSSGVTDQDGKFSLIYDGEKSGALVGKHRVRIFTQLGGPDTEGTVQPAKRGVKVQGEPIPPEWNEYSEKEFEVPAGGTDSA